MWRQNLKNPPENRLLFEFLFELLQANRLLFAEKTLLQKINRRTIEPIVPNHMHAIACSGFASNAQSIFQNDEKY